MSKRVAILIGSASYAGNLADLLGPRNDVESLSSVLSDPLIGHFDDVQILIDKPSHELRLYLERTLSSLKSGDTLLIHFSGHGKLDSGGQLCLATIDSQDDVILSTSVGCGFLRELFRNCQAESKVVWLDCCYSGAAGASFTRGSINDQIQLMRGTGTFILAASTEAETVSERESDVDGVVMGDFSRAIWYGLKTGAADVNRRGYITVSDLFHYLESNLRHSKPRLWAFQSSGNIVVAKHAMERGVVSLDNKTSVTDLRLLLKQVQSRRRTLMEMVGSSPLRMEIRVLNWMLAGGYILRFVSIATVALLLPILSIKFLWLPNSEFIGDWTWPIRICVLVLSLLPTWWTLPLILDKTESFITAPTSKLDDAERQFRLTPDGAELNWTKALSDYIESVLSNNGTQGMYSLIEEARKQIEVLRRQVAVVIAKAGRARAEKDRESKQTDDWEERAATAARAGRDDLGQQAVARMIEHRNQLESLEAEYKRISADAENMREWLVTQNALLKELTSIRDLMYIRVPAYRNSESQPPFSENMIKFLNTALKMFSSSDGQNTTSVAVQTSRVEQEYRDIKERSLEKKTN